MQPEEEEPVPRPLRGTLLEWERHEVGRHCLAVLNVDVQHCAQDDLPGVYCKMVDLAMGYGFYPYP